MESALHSERMARFAQAGLYLVTSRAMSGGRTTLQVIERALAGGVSLVQLREKQLADPELLKLAREARRLTDEAGALLLINDRQDIAMECGADGVHLGQEDMPLMQARKRAPDMIIGGSSHSLEEALAAEAAGASYVNIGPIFSTGTKKWEKPFLGVGAIAGIAPRLSIPWTVMGGIKRHHIPDLVAAGARTIAVVTAVTMADDIEAAARDLLNVIRSCPDSIQN